VVEARNPCDPALWRLPTPVALAVPWVFAFSMHAEQSIVVDPKSPGGINSPHGLILFDGVCVLCSRGCGFVSKRDRRGYFRFVPMQLTEGRPLADQLGINPDRPVSFAFVANGQAYVKSEAVLRIARELPRWQWTWLFHFIPRVIRDAIYDLVARNRYRWFGRRDACILPTRDKTRKPGKPPLPVATVQRVVDLALSPPPGEATHWTGRMLAKAAGSFHALAVSVS
jgi:predicted DCC family thiol-disulfide oxidoreductase YuxK